MVSHATSPGPLVLVPPARAEGNPLAAMLRRDGMRVLEFPRIEPRPPADRDALAAAVRGVARFDWVLFAGSRSVRHFFELLSGEAGIPGRIATLGSGARAGVRERGREPDYHPSRHTAEDVAAGWSLEGGERVLLVRAEGATDDLPRALADRGAEVRAVDGYGMDVEVDPAAVALFREVGVLALASGTAARYLARGLERAGLGPPALAASRAIAVGEATAGIARELGFPVKETAEGTIRALAARI